jgi:hypothetical protein
LQTHLILYQQRAKTETEIEVKANKNKMNKDFGSEDGGKETKFQNLELTEAQQQKSETGTKERRKYSTNN